jgi:phasin family protein
MVSIEHLVNAQKLNAEFLFALNAKAFEGFEKLVTLNVEATKAAMQELADFSRAFLSAKDAEAMFRLQHDFLQPAAENAAQYTRQAHEIAQETWAQLAQAIVHSASESPRNLSKLVASAVQSAPAGTENAVEIVKSTVTAATSAYEGMQKAASDVMAANLQALSAATAGNHANGKSKAPGRAMGRTH